MNKYLNIFPKGAFTSSWVSQPFVTRTANFSPIMFQRAYSAELERPEVVDRVVSLLSLIPQLQNKQIDVESHLQNDLGLDSLDVVEVVVAVEEEFCIEIPDHEQDKIATVKDVTEYVLSQPDAK